MKILRPPTEPTLGQSIMSRDNNFNAARLLFAIGIVVEHVNQTWAGPEHTAPQIGGVSISIIGLFAFFVMSGIFIAHSVVLMKDLRAYALSRILRIYPGLIFLMAVMFFLIGPLTATEPYWTNPQSYLYPLNVFAFADTAGGPPGFFPDNPIPFEYSSPLWTLRYDVIFYIAAIALLPAFGVLKRAYLIYGSTALLGVIMFITGAPFEPIMDNTTITWTVSFGFCFGLGVCVWLIRDNVRGRFSVLLASIALMAIAVYFEMGVAVAASLVATAAVLWLGIAKPVPFFNKHDISFGLYIWHFPICQILVGTGIATSIWVLAAYAYPITVCVAVFSWFYVERPAKGLKNTILTRMKGQVVTA